MFWLARHKGRRRSRERCWPRRARRRPGKTVACWLAPPTKATDEEEDAVGRAEQDMDLEGGRTEVGGGGGGGGGGRRALAYPPPDDGCRETTRR